MNSIIIIILRKNVYLDFPFPFPLSLHIYNHVILETWIQTPAKLHYFSKLQNVIDAKMYICSQYV